MRFSSRLCCVLLLSFAAAGSAAASNSSHQTVSFDPQAFAEQRQELENEIRSGKRYAGIRAKDREQVLEALDRLERNLEGVSAVAQLDDVIKVQVFNDQELVNNLLTEAAEDSRMVCTRERAVGSHMATKVCKTVGQRRLEREQSKDVMRNTMRAKLVPKN
jgi:hypothetical protein